MLEGVGTDRTRDEGQTIACCEFAAQSSSDYSGSRLRCVVAGCFVHFVWSHLAGNIAHLLADVVPASPGRKGLELSCALI
jgi:hypothetical protein